MSFRFELKQYAEIKRLEEADVDGAPVYTWLDIADHVPCMTDTFYQRGYRQPNDPNFVPESERPSPRTGAAFFLKDAPVLPGDRLVVTTQKGVPFGTFEVGTDYQLILDRIGNVHHLEVGVSEVAQPLGRM